MGQKKREKEKTEEKIQMKDNLKSVLNIYELNGEKICLSESKTWSFKHPVIVKSA